MQLRDSESGLGWLSTNVMLVCCCTVQLLRGRKPDESERIAKNFDRAKAAMTAADAGEAPAAGRKCESPACSAREAFSGAFKLCGKCRAVPYCCIACQVRLLPRRCQLRADSREHRIITDGGLEASQALQLHEA